MACMGMIYEDEGVVYITLKGRFGGPAITVKVRESFLLSNAFACIRMTFWTAIRAC